MTARRSVRVRNGWLGVLAAVVALGLVAGLGFVGVRSLLNSSAGTTAVAGDDSPIQRLPYTPTGLLAVTDDDGVLTSAAAVVVEPDGTGGTLVPLAALADAGAGSTGVLRPLRAVLEAEGPEGFTEAAEQLTGLSFDVAEIVTAARFADLIAPLGDLTAVLPSTVVDASSAEQWEAGTRVLGSAAAARLLTARSPDVPDWFFEPDREAVWIALADRVGAGIGSAEPAAAGDRVPVPGSMDELFDRLLADRVEARPLVLSPVDDDRVEAELDAPLVSALTDTGGAPAAVANTRSELLLVFASVAPSRLGAPLEASTVRIELGLSDEFLTDAGWTRADAAERAVSIALFAGLNVVSVVDDSPQAADDATYVDVASEADLEDAWELFPDLYGEAEVRLADVRIDGVDAVIRLGRSWLADLEPPSVDQRSDDVPTTGDASDDAPDDADQAAASADSATPPTTSAGPDPSRPDPAEIEAELNAVVGRTPIRFEPGSSTLAADAGPALDALAATLSGLADVTVVVAGHTDSDGEAETNLDVSQARADAVVDALVERDVDAALLSAEGRGETEPVLIDGVEDKTASRRVEFEVTASP